MKYNNKNLLLLIEEVLQEVLSDVVYHYTNLTKLNSILEEDKFMTSVALGNISDFRLNKEKMYFFSTARSKRGSYSSKSFQSVQLVLNGQKLSQNYKGGPVDFWGQYDKEKGHSETEDRVFTNKPYIENASKYILEIHIDMDSTHKENWEDILDKLKKVGDLSQKNNIPIFIYNNGNDWTNLNKEKAFKSVDKYLEFIKLNNIKINPAKERLNMDMKNSSEYKTLEAIGKVLNSFEKLKTKEDFQEIFNNPNQYYQFFLKKIMSYKKESDFELYITTEIRNVMSHKEFRPLIDNIVQFMRRNKIKNIEGIYDFLKSKEPLMS